MRSGKYRIAITASSEDLVANAPKRTALGPDPKEMTKIANQTKKLIPDRYANAQESGLTAELSLGNHTLDLELVD